jgi:hypothetical protein
MADLGGTYTVVRRSLTEALFKNEKKSVWTVVLRNSDGHCHTITSTSQALWDEYPFGAEKELVIEKSRQTRLAVDDIRETQVPPEEKQGEDE